MRCFYFCRFFDADLFSVLASRHKLRRAYVDGLNVHVFAYFLLLALAFANETVGIILSVSGISFFWFAMQRVFGSRWWAISLRYLIIGSLYPIMLVTFVMLTTAIAIFI